MLFNYFKARRRVEDPARLAQELTLRAENEGMRSMFNFRQVGARKFRGNLTQEVSRLPVTLTIKLPAAGGGRVKRVA